MPDKIRLKTNFKLRNFIMQSKSLSLALIILSAVTSSSVFAQNLSCPQSFQESQAFQGMINRQEEVNVQKQAIYKQLKDQLDSDSWTTGAVISVLGAGSAIVTDLLAICFTGDHGDLTAGFKVAFGIELLAIPGGIALSVHDHNLAKALKPKVAQALIEAKAEADKLEVEKSKNLECQNQAAHS